METSKPPSEREEGPRQHNVVFHFKVCWPEEAADQLDLEDLVKRAAERDYSYQLFHNFLVLRRGPLCFTLFFKSGHVNCSGTRTTAGIGASLLEAEEIFRKKLTVDDTTISSTTWSGRFPHNLLNIPSCQQALHDSGRPIRVSLRPSRFPGGVVRSDNHPTLILFRNGKYIVVGAKSESEVKEALDNVRPSLRCMCRLTNECSLGVW